MSNRLVAIAGLAIVYFVAGKLGLTLAYDNPSASPVWPPSGIALAALLLFGLDLWPGVLIGAFVVNATTAGSLATSAGITAGNTLEAVVGALLVTRFAGGRRALDHAADIFKFALLAAFVSTTVSATVGVTSLCLGGSAPWSGFGPIWITWWLGDASGDLVVAPLVLAWLCGPHEAWTMRQRAEGAALLAALLLVGGVVFAGFSPLGLRNYPLEFLCIPVLVWTAFRFRQREAATANLILSAIAIWGTLNGFGPFWRQRPNESLLLLQAFMAVVAVTSLAVAAVVANADAASRTKSEFLGLVSHELRTPLTALLLHIERLKRDKQTPLSARQSDIVGAMSVSSRRLTEMIEGLLHYVRIERGGLHVSLSAIALAPLIVDALDELRFQADGKGLILTLAPHAELPPLVTDPHLLRLVVTNLVGNAIKFTNEGAIDVSLAHDGGDGCHRITVRDTGPGIAPDQQTRIFAPFEQLEPLSEKHVRGIGLGLSLVREIMLALGGRVELVSALGAGSAFTLVLPRPEGFEETAATA